MLDRTPGQVFDAPANDRDDPCDEGGQTAMRRCMQRATLGAGLVLALGLTACGDDSEDAMSALTREAQEACVQTGEAEEACNCFVTGLLEAVEQEDADLFLRMVTADEDERLEIVGDDPMAATQAMMRLSTAIAPVAARCGAGLELGLGQ